MLILVIIFPQKVTAKLSYAYMLLCITRSVKFSLFTCKTKSTLSSDARDVDPNAKHGRLRGIDARLGAASADYEHKNARQSLVHLCRA